MHQTEKTEDGRTDLIFSIDIMHQSEKTVGGRTVLIFCTWSGNTFYLTRFHNDIF